MKKLTKGFVYTVLDTLIEYLETLQDYCAEKN